MGVFFGAGVPLNVEYLGPFVIRPGPMGPDEEVLPKLVHVFMNSEIAKNGKVKKSECYV